MADGWMEKDKFIPNPVILSIFWIRWWTERVWRGRQNVEKLEMGRLLSIFCPLRGKNYNVFSGIFR
jgi:hypothetical protein